MFSGSLPGFKDGGQFTVGGAGGVDSQLVAFRATPGEMVDIRTPGNDNSQSGSINIALDAGDFGVKQYVVDVSRQTAVEVTGAGLQGYQRAQGIGRRLAR